MGMRAGGQCSKVQVPTTSPTGTWSSGDKKLKGKNVIILNKKSAIYVYIYMVLVCIFNVFWKICFLCFRFRWFVRKRSSVAAGCLFNAYLWSTRLRIWRADTPVIQWNDIQSLQSNELSALLDPMFLDQLLVNPNLTSIKIPYDSVILCWWCGNMSCHAVAHGFCVKVVKHKTATSAMMPFISYIVMVHKRFVHM